MIHNGYSAKKLETCPINNGPLYIKYLYANNILTVDLIKIDTEGHEFEVLKGLKTNIKNVNTIIFEHHYDNMIKKKYTFSDIHNFLKQNSFIKVFKVKMPFRKSFEYIYVKNR